MIGRLTNDMSAPNPAEITKFEEINQHSRRSFALLDRGGKRAVQGRFRIGSVA
jgi:hypothetical protein